MEQSRSSSLNNDKISDNTQITITLGKNSHEDQSNEFWSDPFVKGNSSQNPHQFYNNIQPHQQLIQQK
jgi:sulfur relay (sulfurtransferase) complex TusBCD TusD component (DsrE family)